MNENSTKNKSDSQSIIEEINLLKERLSILKKEEITQENIKLVQQLDGELADKLLQISTCSSD